MEAKEGIEKIARAEAERHAARPDAVISRANADVAGSVRARVEYELTRVQQALAALEEARRKAEDKASCLADEGVFLLLELRASKDKLSAFRVEASKEKKALDEAFDVGFDVIFNYGYDCCAFPHNICGSEPVIPNGISDTSKPFHPKFFYQSSLPPGCCSYRSCWVPEADTSRADEHLTTVGAGDISDSSAGAAGLSEEPGVFGGI